AGAQSAFGQFEQASVVQPLENIVRGEQSFRMFVGGVLEALIKCLARIPWREFQKNGIGHTFSLAVLWGCMDRLARRHWFTFGHFVIDSFPFSLHLDALLRRGMVKT